LGELVGTKAVPVNGATHLATFAATLGVLAFAELEAGGGVHAAGILVTWKRATII
jgi:hypothetical protein